MYAPVRGGEGHLDHHQALEAVRRNRDGQFDIHQDIDVARSAGLLGALELVELDRLHQQQVLDAEAEGARAVVAGLVGQDHAGEFSASRTG